MLQEEWEKRYLEHSKRMKQEQRALNQQRTAVVKLPTRKDRSEVRLSLYTPFKASLIFGLRAIDGSKSR